MLIPFAWEEAPLMPSFRVRNRRRLIQIKTPAPCGPTMAEAVFAPKKGGFIAEERVAHAVAAS
jgi:hypothetical protein